jgi:hypothetical protein
MTARLGAVRSGDGVLQSAATVPRRATRRCVADAGEELREEALLGPLHSLWR